MEADIIKRREILLNDLKSFWENPIHFLKSMENSKSGLFHDLLDTIITRYEDKISFWEKMMKHLNMEPSKRCFLVGDNSYFLLGLAKCFEKKCKIRCCFPINDFHGGRKKQNVQGLKVDVDEAWKVDQEYSNNGANVHLDQLLYDA